MRMHTVVKPCCGIASTMYLNLCATRVARILCQYCMSKVGHSETCLRPKQVKKGTGMRKFFYFRHHTFIQSDRLAYLLLLFLRCGSESK